MDVFDQVSAYIRDHALLRPGERVVVGLSGGADSLCLLDCLSRWGVDVVVAHLDHQLRPESAADAAFAEALADRYGHPFELGKADLHPGQGGSLEERARLQRYSFLAAVARKDGAEKVAVGHTYDDQVETILMHLLRGAGPSGLRGILPETQVDDWAGISGEDGISLVRPLLSIRHAETMAHCETIGLEPRFDRSNLDQRFFRNKIRHHLLQVLEGYNPGVRPVIYRLGEIMRAEVDFLSDQVEHRWQEVVVELAADGLIIRGRTFKQQPLAIQRGLIRRAILALRQDLRDLGFEHIERGVKYILAPDRPTSQPLIGDLLIYDYDEDVLLAAVEPLPALPDFPQMSAGESKLSVPGEVQLEYGWKILSAEIENDLAEVTRAKADGWDVVIDKSSLSTPLSLRTRRPGDRMQPLGMQGRIKISDLMINSKIPRLARAHWPLLFSGGEIVWVPGLNIGHSFRIKESTNRAVHLKVLPGDAAGSRN